MKNSDNNIYSNDSLKTNSKKVLWRKNSSHLPGSILLVTNPDLPTTSENKNNDKFVNKETNNNSKDFFNYIFAEENWTENFLTGSQKESTINKNCNNNNQNQLNTLNNNSDIHSNNIHNLNKNEKDNTTVNKNIINENIKEERTEEIRIERLVAEGKNNNNINDNNNEIKINNNKVHENKTEINISNIELNNNKNEINNNKKEDNNKTEIKKNNISEKNIRENNKELNNKEINIEYNQQENKILNKIEELNIQEEHSTFNEESTEKKLEEKLENPEKIQEEKEINMNDDSSYSAHKIKQFEELLNTPNIDLVKLKKLSWSGIPKRFRPMVWQLLMGYLPRNQDRRDVTLARKRKDFADTANQAFSKGVAGLDYTLYHQIHIDVPRTNPSSSIYQNKKIQKSLERILYCWAIRHPASGYVQGINDLVTPFYYVFLSSYLDSDLETYDIDSIPDNIFEAVEADSFWCLTNLLDGIQDSYTYNQPGIHRQVQKLEEFIKRVDLKLYNHFKKEDVQFIQFAFRWMNCLLMRELKLEHTIRMWDTYQSEPEGFSEFHLYVCAAFLVKWSKQLLKMEFQDIMIFLQNLPTSDWTEKDIEMLLSEAYMWKCLFHDSPNHIS